MAIPADVQAALARLVQYNSNPVGAENPYGLGNYGNLTNFPLALSDLVTVAGWFGATGGLPGPPGADGADGDDGNDGWTPVLAIVNDGARRVQQIVDWTGGEGAKPATGKYVGAAGFVSDIASAVDIRGASGAGTGDVVGPNASGNGNIALFDGITGKLLKDSGVLLGTAASKNVGAAAGNVPLLDGSGKLDPATLPALAINDVFSVSSQAAMLALDAQRGDMAVRLDTGETYILSADAPTVLANWIKIPIPAGVVTSIAGLVGPTITATALRIALGLVVGSDVQAYDAATAKTNAAQQWTAGQRSGATALASGTSIAIDAAATNDYSLTLANNATLANFTNATANVGKKGSITGQQDATGGRTLAYGANWFPIGSASAPAVPTAANAKFRIDYHIVSSTRTDFTVSSVGV